MGDRHGAASVPPGARPSRAALVDRLWLAAEVQVRAHETRLKGLGGQPAGAEAEAKSLATLARTLKELIELDHAAQAADREDDNPNDDSPDGALSDLASLRSELARRLDGLRACDGGGAPRSA
jgi:hypothetical protein